jgi:CheY-like chemotaxis protein
VAHILLVDDDPVLSSLLARLVRRLGHTLVLAGSGAEALALAAAQPFDLIITDVMMPDQDGYELTRALRAQPATRETRILIFTSRLQGPDADLALAAGADAYVMKTVNLDRLNAAITQLLDAGRTDPGALASAAP